MRSTLIILSLSYLSLFFFFNDTATTEIYTLSLHDALPISRSRGRAAGLFPKCPCSRARPSPCPSGGTGSATSSRRRSEEHTSELQSHSDLVCRLLLEKKKKEDKSARV